MSMRDNEREVPSGLAQTLAHHDAAINNLSGRMSGVEQSLHKLGDDVSKGFSDIGSKLATLDATKPPSMMQQITSFSVVLTIVGGVVWGITYISMSVVEPKIVALNQDVGMVSKHVDRRTVDDIDELKAYRREEKETVKSQLSMVQQQLQDLQKKYGWVARTQQASASKKTAN